jgi:hypothetical protein
LAQAEPMRKIQVIPSWLFLQDDTKKGNEAGSVAVHGIENFVQ